MRRVVPTGRVVIPPNFRMAFPTVYGGSACSVAANFEKFFRACKVLNDYWLGAYFLLIFEMLNDNKCQSGWSVL